MQLDGVRIGPCKSTLFYSYIFYGAKYGKKPNLVLTVILWLILQICNNGIISLSADGRYRQNCPTLFGTDPYFDTVPLIAPFWGQSDEATMKLLENEWPEARTRVLYNTYDTKSGSSVAKEILARAKEDVLLSGN